MIQEHNATDGKRASSKRMLAAGRKINGIWQVKTFLHSAATTGETFWEAGARGRSKRGRGN